MSDSGTDRLPSCPFCGSRPVRCSLWTKKKTDLVAVDVGGVKCPDEDCRCSLAFTEEAWCERAPDFDAARYRWLKKKLEGAVGGGVEVNDEKLLYEEAKPGEEVRVFWYPDTPIGFIQIHGSTMDEAIDKAMMIEKEGELKK